MEPYDVLCIGGGGAGVTAAVIAALNGAKVALVSRDPIGYGNTRIAIGNLANAGLVEGDNPAIMAEDMLKGGDFLNDPDLVEALSQETSFATALLEGFGHIFKRDSEGRIGKSVVSRAGGHSFPRGIASASQGVAMGQALRAASVRASIDLIEEHFVTELLVDDGRVGGAAMLDVVSGEPRIVPAKTVILCTGGAGWLYYPHTDCLRTATGDGYALAYNAGAELVDMEQIQFIPFAVTNPKPMTGLFLGESNFAGPDGKLINGKSEVILTEINTRTRAEVSKVIALELAKGNATCSGGIALDLSGNLETPGGKGEWEAHKKAGRLDLVRAAYGSKAYRWEQPFDVLPTAHHVMGGVRVDPEGRTNIAGLYAAGEAAGGLHGGNRLGAVALTELFVFGRRAGLAASQEALKSPHKGIPQEIADRAVGRINRFFGTAGRNRPIRIIRALQDTMWQAFGPARNEQDGISALARITEYREEAGSLSTAPFRRYNTEVCDAIELNLMLTTSRLIAISALERRETRGAHCRTDYPALNNDSPPVSYVVKKGEEGPRLSALPHQQRQEDS